MNKIGDVNYNEYNEKMTITAYRSATDIDVTFEDNTVVKSRADHFREGTVKNFNCKVLYNLGYLGYGKYKCSDNGKISKCYNTWKGMFERCYDITYLKKEPTYIGCTVCEEWHNFQNFSKWYEDNFYQIPNEIMCIDKDILYKGNKVYSPNTCIFVTKAINNLFTKRTLHRGNLPIGVIYHKTRDRYIARLGTNMTYVGSYKTPEEAFEGYKFAKENNIKNLANLYKKDIPKKLYNAMMNYVVEITD